ncbi:MAG: altronate dehydratase [Hyphomonadaceae bacterium]|nr:altronate dehydratase [Hyphomonadaceae bacterium]
MIVATAIPDALIVSARDTVAVALRDLEPGAAISVGGEAVTLRGPVARGHKIALARHEKGEAVIKYGAPIGHATEPVDPGAHVHLHNLATNLSGVDDYVFAPRAETRARPRALAGSFEGYRRADGRVGVRNEIWVIATVGCVANVCMRIAQRASVRHADRVDGIHAITHPFGCSQLGDDLSGTRNILAALASHPNAGGVLLVGLGCESNQLDALLAAAPRLDPARVRCVRAQSETDEQEAGLRAIDTLVEQAARDVRTTCGAEDLVLGLKCGGSDGFSGLTANPLVGGVADRIVAAGGTAILTEIPEMFGAAHILLERAGSREVFNSLATMINRFKQHFLDNGQPVYENPSPGNHAGGITTLEEKSLGAVQKAGAATVTDSIRYGESWRRAGVTVLEAPGNDAVSGTALVAAGATIVLFTTGRGTPLGFPAPTIKISSNSVLAQRKPQWIDFDAGVLLEGRPRWQTEDALVADVLAIASGRPARNEANGERSIAIWKRGVTL